MKSACVILAAGLGTRMKSPTPKVLHKICGRPMLQGVIDAARDIRPERIIVVCGKQLEEIRSATDSRGIIFSLQEKPKGTAHALSCALPGLKGFSGDVLVLNGDAPLVTSPTLRKFLRRHRQGGNAVSVLSFGAGNPTGYGRIVRDGSGRMLEIVEEKDADDRQKGIGEVNSGVYALRHDVLPLLASIRMNMRKGEYYLTDIVSAALKSGFRTSAFCLGDEEEFMGVNTKEELLRAARLMKKRLGSYWTRRGANLIDPDSVYIDAGVLIGRDATIYPNVFLEGKTRIGRSAVIYPNVRITNSILGDGAVVMDSTVVEDSIVRKGASVGPFARIRPGSDIGPGAKIGNFVEVKKSIVGKGAKASHLSYLGDADIGSGVNIGAGTITCNYDGLKKYRTVIEDGVFIGSDSQLVAPVRVGKGAYVGAGSTITKDVPAGSLAISRSEQRHIAGWAKKKTLSGRRKPADRRGKAN